MNIGRTLHSASSCRGERFTTGTPEGLKEIMGAIPALPEGSKNTDYQPETVECRMKYAKVFHAERHLSLIHI